MGTSPVLPGSSNDKKAGAKTDQPTVQATSENGTGYAMTLDGENEASTGAGDAVAMGNDEVVPPIEQHPIEEQRPPLPPRPSLLQVASRPGTVRSKDKQRPALQSKPTTAISSVDIQTLSFPDGSRGTFPTPASRSASESVSVSATSGGQSTPSRAVGHKDSEVDDSTSLMSYAPTLKVNGGDLSSLLDEGLNTQSPAWKLLSSQSDNVNPFESVEYEDFSLLNFEQEFDEIEAVDSKGGNEGW